MTRKQKRLSVVLAGLLFLGAASGLTSYALGHKTSYFYMPTDLAAAGIPPGQRVRLGGLVEKGTIMGRHGATVLFSVTDTQQSVKVTYTGILPDLFREEQGVIAEDAFGPDGVFMADSVLAKHDERYMPKEAAEGLKARGVWQESASKAHMAAD